MPGGAVWLVQRRPCNTDTNLSSNRVHVANVVQGQKGRGRHHLSNACVPESLLEFSIEDGGYLRTNL